jgi:hypothetical protein
MTSDLDIFGAAKLWPDGHGDAAITKARHRAADLHAAGERDGADIRLRIILAIETLLMPPTGAH